MHIARRRQGCPRVPSRHRADNITGRPYTATPTTAHSLIMAANPNTVGMITFSISSLLSRQANDREWWPAVRAAKVILRDHGKDVGLPL